MDIKVLRHSVAHLMAMAVQRLFPSVHFGIGPAIDDGFYYDFDLDKRLQLEDLDLIEKEMITIVEEKLEFTRLEKFREDAKKFFIENGENFKVEIIDDL